MPSTTHRTAALTAAAAALGIDVLLVTGPGADVVAATLWTAVTVALCFGLLLGHARLALAGALLQVAVLVVVALALPVDLRGLGALALQGLATGAFVVAAAPQLLALRLPRRERGPAPRRVPLGGAAL
jgi:hypothetical protein